MEECKPLLLGSATNAGDVVCCFATDQSHLSYVASLCSSLGLGFAALDFPGSLCRGIGTGASAGAGSVDSGTIPREMKLALGPAASAASHLKVRRCRLTLSHPR